MKQTCKTAGKLMNDAALLLALAISPVAIAQDDLADDEDRQARREQFQEQLRENMDERRALMEEQRDERRQALEDNPELREQLRKEQLAKRREGQERLGQQRNPRRALGVGRGPNLRDVARRQLRLRQAIPPVRQFPGRPALRGNLR